MDCFWQIKTALVWSNTVPLKVGCSLEGKGNKKSLIRETLTLLTCADSCTDTMISRLFDTFLHIWTLFNHFLLLFVTFLALFGT